MDEVFDLCDVSSKGSVSIYKLLSFAMEHGGIDTENEDVKKEILSEVLLKLNPSGQDTEIDKTTWIAAWGDIKGTEDDNVPNERIDNNNGVLDEFSLFNASGSPDTLNQSKRSYCFSPSDTSSPAMELNSSNGEEIANLRHRIRSLQENLRLMQSQLQLSEDALVSEQTQNGEILQKISRLDEKILALHRDCEAHETQLTNCEAEKLTLCCTVKKQQEEIRELRIGLEEKTEENNCLSSELKETQERLDAIQKLEDNTIKELAQYQDIFHNQEEQLQARQATIDKFKTENEEINLQLGRLQWENRNLSTRCEELESEIRQAVSHHCHPAINLSMASLSHASAASNESEDVPSSVVWHSIATGVTSTPMSLPVSKLKTNSLMQEFEAMGSFTSKVCLESSSEDEGCKDIVSGVLGTCTSSAILPTVALKTLTNDDEKPLCYASISVKNYVPVTSCNELESDLRKEGSIQHKMSGGIKGRSILRTEDHKQTSLGTMHSSLKAALTQVPNLLHKSVQTSRYESMDQSTQAGESFHSGDVVPTHSVKYCESKEASVQVTPAVKESCAQTDEQVPSDERTTPLCSRISKSTSTLTDYVINDKQIGQSDNFQAKTYESPTSTCQEMPIGDRPSYSCDVTAPVLQLKGEDMHSTVPDELLECFIPFKQTPLTSVGRKRHFDKRQLYSKTESRLEDINYYWMVKKLNPFRYLFFKFIFICTLFCLLLLFGVMISTAAIFEVAVEKGLMGKLGGAPPPWIRMFSDKLKSFVDIRVENVPL